jgi:two-component system, chemotaxis family, response regulator Rcp1
MELNALIPMINILMIEDNPGDARLAMEAFKAAKLVNDVYWVEDGNAAMAFLKKEGRYAQASRPDLILLDLYLPGRNASMILADLKNNPEYQSIPVVLLMSTEIEEHLIMNYEFQPDRTMVKPLDLEQFIAVILSIEDFGLMFVKGFKPH